MSRNTTLPLIFALMATVLVAASPATAGVVLPDDSPDHPERTPLTLVSQQVDVEIVDQVATTTLVQVFRNDGPSPVAGTYLLPLNERASVMEYAFWVGGRRVVSSVQAKADAEATFDGASKRGEDASILAHRDPDTFTARFTSLDPGETRRFEVVYGELLPYEAGTVRYSHPLDYATMGLPEVEDVRVRVNVADGKPITAMTSSTWDIDVSETATGMLAEARLVGAVPEADFELAYTLTSSDFGLTFRTYADGDDEGFFVAMVAPQEETTDQQIVRKDVAFVFDVSGSMDGPKIDQARSALKACLNLMNPGDGAYVVAFNDGLNPWRGRVEELDSKSRADAVAFVDGLKAGGGTNIQDAVLATLDMLQGSDRPTALVFLTDGLGNRPVEETLDKVVAANTGTRIFSFGVGNDVNQPFLERLGRENRGSYNSIRGNVAIDEVVADFYSSISRPVLTDLRMDMGEVVANRSYPSVLPDVYKGQRLVITGRYRGAGPQTMTVSGRIAGEERTLELPVDFPVEATEDRWVARLWAKRRAEHLLADVRMYGETPEAKDEIVALSTEYRFATPYTSLVAHADPRVASLTPARVKPGDPVLAIPAPFGSVAVTAFLPFGEVKDLVLDDESGLWVTRFLVPRSVQDGVYWIHVVATDPMGRSEWFKIAYTIDTLAPVVRIRLEGGEGRGGDTFYVGESIEVSTRPVIGFLELGAEMVRALGRDAAARAKAFVDVKQVVARLAGTDIETVLVSTEGSEPGWHGRLELPMDLPAGDYRLEVTATDTSGNKHTVTHDVHVERGAVSALY
jgi:Ca-activated chloride channel homolog